MARGGCEVEFVMAELLNGGGARAAQHDSEAVFVLVRAKGFCDSPRHPAESTNVVSPVL